MDLANLDFKELRKYIKKNSTKKTFFEGEVIHSSGYVVWLEATEESVIYEVWITEDDCEIVEFSFKEGFHFKCTCGRNKSDKLCFHSVGAGFDIIDEIKKMRRKARKTAVN